ncbi:MAG TPA: hypothetical protein VFW54_01360, partial [Propionibacteriaceae bacterium]|nr:hypothetical protein [Propionibacteriaceae bacterium]
TRTGPAVVMLWAQAEETADVAQLHMLLTGSGRPLLVLAGGPGWDTTLLPAEVLAPVSLGDAVRLAIAAADSSEASS